MTTCACGATTEGEPWANGWGRYMFARGVVEEVQWRCPRCSGGLNLRSSPQWSFADAVDHEEGLP